MTDRESCIRCARVYLAQSRHFTSRHRGFSFALLNWAVRQRRKAMALRDAPVQQALF
ncbi:hypothetical protein [Aquamicrobium sp.]|uniref:hypothetical protein n=1 Tax=Aquamicrobium sp. TaxID=1872579 RepID=UPI00258F263D|nr:hypothetical protein [Aquamicrobium sp.]MCK9550261.1 hypothetical protein [Aquamicrobium sp.]